MNIAQGRLSALIPELVSDVVSAKINLFSTLCFKDIALVPLNQKRCTTISLCDKCYIHHKYFKDTCNFDTNSFLCFLQEPWCNSFVHLVSQTMYGGQTIFYRVHIKIKIYPYVTYFHF